MSIHLQHEAYIEWLQNLKQDTIFYGTIEKIERDGFRYRYYFNLFNERTNRFDDLVDQMETVNMVPYTFELAIKTNHTDLFSQRQAIYQFERVDEIEQHPDCFPATILLNIHRRYDRFNPFKNKTIYVKVTKASDEVKQDYQQRMARQLNWLKEHSTLTKHLSLSYGETFNELVGVRYSQYYVGLGNSSYLNLGDSSRGFFNIGYVKDEANDLYHYTGFSRHKPDFVIISSLEKENYNAAIRYGNDHLFSCDWIMPHIPKYHLNLFRLYRTIIRHGGRLYFLQYVANTSVFTIEHPAFDFQVYFESDVSMKRYGLSLFLRYKDQFISIGNADYNFKNKSLVYQHFDLIVLPHQSSRIKVRLQRNVKTGPLTANPVYRLRSGFKTHRVDKQGSFIYKLK